MRTWSQLPRRSAWSANAETVLILAVTLSFLFMPGAGSAFAQEQQPRGPINIEKGDTLRSPPRATEQRMSIRQNSRPTVGHVQRPGSVSLARQILTLQRQLTRDPEHTLRQLRNLERYHPHDPQLRFLLAQACRLTGDFASAEELLRGLLTEFPESRGFHQELLHTLFRADKESEALAMLEPVLGGRVTDSGEYESVAEMLQQVGRYELALDVYGAGLKALPPHDDRGRVRLTRAYLNQLNLAGRSVTLLRVLARELHRIEDLGQRARLLSHGEKLLAELERPRDLIPLADSLMASGEAGPLEGGLRHLYLAVGDYGSFADQVLLGKLDGRLRAAWLFDQAARCLEAKRGEVLRRRGAAERIFAAVLDEPRLTKDLEGRTRYQLAVIALEEDGDRRLQGDRPGERDVSALRRQLAELREAVPGTVWAEQALLNELHYLRERLRHPGEADSLLRVWLLEPDRLHDVHSAWGLELELGENLMALEDLAGAREHYEYLLQRVSSSLVGNWARYRLAQLSILDGESVAAQDSLAGLAKDDPGGVLANDALDLALLLAESAMWPETVQSFLFGALRLEFTARPGEAAERLLAFASEFPDDDASSALLYHAGNLLNAAWRGPEALDAWLLLADHHAQDFRAPQGLEAAARLSYRLGEHERARALLERILNEHPDFPLRPGLRDLQDLLVEDES